MKLYLVRHGETEWNRMEKIQGQVEIPLNNRGREMARKTSDLLAEIPFDAAFSSPLSRAYETGKIILGERVIEIVKRAELLEIGFGVWEGYSIRKAKENPDDRLYNFFQKPEAYKAPATAETYMQLYARSSNFLKNIILPLENKKETILITTHSAWIRSVVNPLMGMELKDFWKNEIPNCAVSIIDVKNGGMKLEKAVVTV